MTVNRSAMTAKSNWMVKSTCQTALQPLKVENAFESETRIVVKMDEGEGCPTNSVTGWF